MNRRFVHSRSQLDGNGPAICIRRRQALDGPGLAPGLGIFFVRLPRLAIRGERRLRFRPGSEPFPQDRNPAACMQIVAGAASVRELGPVPTQA